MTRQQRLSRSIRATIEALDSRRLLAVVSNATLDFGGTNQGINYVFDSSVSQTDFLGALNLHKLISNDLIDDANLALSPTGPSSQYRLTWPGLPATGSTVAGQLEDGHYEAIVEDGTSSVFSTSHVLSFGFYRGDTDGDTDVDFDDLLTVAQNYGMSGRTYSQGDFDLNGTVNFDDLLIVAQKYGGRLAPMPVGNNTLTVGSQTASSLTLNFTPPLHPGTTQISTLFTGFRVYRSTNGVDFTQISSDNDPLLQRDGSTTYSWTDTNGLSEGTKYWYRVRPFNDVPSDGAPGGSWHTTNKEWAVTTLAPPSQLTATPASSTAVDLSWVNSSSMQTGFVVQRATDIYFMNGLTSFNVNNPNATGYQDTTVTSGTTYYYRVKAVNGTTQNSMYSIPANVTPGASMQLYATAGDQQVSLSWTAITNAVNYKIEVSYDGTTFNQNTLLDSSDTTATVQGLDYNMTVWHRVTALDANNAVLNTSPIAGATTTTAPPGSQEADQPAGGTAEAGPEGIARLIVAWYGIDTFNVLSPGDVRVEALTDALGGTVSADRAFNDANPDDDDLGDPLKFDRGRQGVVDLLAKIDGANGGTVDKIITATELSGVEVHFLGYSWGTITAVNESRKLNSAGKLYGYTLQQAVPIKSMVVMDPIHSGPARLVRWVWFSGVLNNTELFANYYQTKGGSGTINYGPIQGSYPTPDTFQNTFINTLKGTTLPSSLPAARNKFVDTMSYGNAVFTEREYTREPAGAVLAGRARVNLANHITLPWIVTPFAVLDIDPNFTVDFNNPHDRWEVTRAVSNT